MAPFAGRQALLVLARLRCGDVHAQLAVGFGIGIAIRVPLHTRDRRVTRHPRAAPGRGHEEDSDKSDRCSKPRNHRCPRRRWADKAYQGPDRPVRVPLRGRSLKGWKRRQNGTHAKIRCLGAQAMAILKGRRLLRKLRCSTNRKTDIVKAVLVL